MSTTSTNFNLVLATASDQVNVVTQIANNFNSLDSILSQVHTGTGQLKAGLNVSNWTSTNPTIVGTQTGGTIVATTGRFQTITATGGALTASTLAVGTYSFPTTVGTTGALLTVVTGNAVWVAPSGGTGANTGLSNLASVAINTSINTFTGGFATLDRVVVTSGALTGLTVFQASTGTFAGNLGVTGTINANAINVTGGAITAAGFAIGTYSYPTTVGSTGQVLTVTTGNAQWVAQHQPFTLVVAGSASGTEMLTFTVAITTGAMYKFSVWASGDASAGTSHSFAIRINNTTAGYNSIGATGAIDSNLTYMPFVISATAPVAAAIGSNGQCVWDGVIYCQPNSAGDGTRIVECHDGIAVNITSFSKTQADHQIGWSAPATATSFSFVNINSSTSWFSRYHVWRVNSSTAV